MGIEFVIDDHSDEPDEDDWWAEHEDDEEDWSKTNYLTYKDPDSSDMDFPANKAGDSWDLECIPESIQKTLQEEWIANHKSSPYEKDWSWKIHWPNIKHDEVDPMMAAADYYLLFGVVNNAFVDFKPLNLPSIYDLEKAGRKLKRPLNEINQRLEIIKSQTENDPRNKLTLFKNEADKKFKTLVELLDKSFREYCHLACGGELRHHSKFSNVLSGFRRGAWVHWWYIYDTHGPDALIEMQSLFHDFPDTAYGGPAWANAAKILWERETGNLGPDEFTNKQLFVDRVFTLEHNGGCFLDKISWKNHREDRGAPYSYDFMSMKDYVLELHASSVLDISEMLKYASLEVQLLTRSFLDFALDSGYDIMGDYEKSDAEFKDNLYWEIGELWPTSINTLTV